MINLLPPELKIERRYGRKNATMISWIVLCIGGIIGLGIVSVAGVFYMSRVENTTLAQKKDLELQLSQNGSEKASKSYESFASDVKTVSAILQKQVLFSKLITRLATVLPDGVTVKQMTLSEKDNALTLDFTLPNRQSATTLQANLQDPTNALFSSADLLNTSCSTSEKTGEVCSAQVRVLFAPGSRLLLYQPAVTKAPATGATK